MWSVRWDRPETTHYYRHWQDVTSVIYSTDCGPAVLYVITRAIDECNGRYWLNDYEMIIFTRHYRMEQLRNDDIIADRSRQSAAADALILARLLFRFSRSPALCLSAQIDQDDDDDVLLQYLCVIYSFIRCKYYYYYLWHTSEISSILASVRNFI